MTQATALQPRPTAYEDVIFAYRLFLNRQPESDAVVEEKLSRPLAALAPDFIGSGEFEAQVLRPVLTGHPQPHTYGEAVGPGLAAWVRDTFQVEASADASFNRLIARVLPIVAPSLSGRRAPQLWSYAAIRLQTEAVAQRSAMRDLLVDVLLGDQGAEAAGLAYEALLRLDVMQGGPVQAMAKPTLALPEEVTQDPDRRLVASSGLWDAGFYLRQKPDLHPASDLLGDYLARGVREGHDPHPLFSTAHYLAACADQPEAAASPLLHYLRHGHLTDRAPNALFSPDWYRREHLAGQTAVEPLGHYARDGAHRRLRPHPLFDRDFYETLYPDIAAAGMDAYEHYIAHGHAEGRRGFDFSQAGRTLKLAVVAHVFYEDLWPELFTRISLIPASYDLIATIPRGAARSLRDRILSDAPHAQVIEVENQGRDIGPFLKVLPLLLDRSYDAVCKIHTKRGVTEPDTWRYLQLESVLGSSELVRHILAWFEQDAHLSTVGGDIFHLDGPMFSQLNMEHLRRLTRLIYGADAEVPPAWGFFAGTMFWVRPQLLANMSKLAAEEQFLDRNASNDGQSAHAVERLFGVAASLQDSRLGLVDVRGPKAAIGVDVRATPFRVSTQELATYLPSRTRELATALPEFSKPHRRSWLVPQGAEPGVNLVGPINGVLGLGVSLRGYARALQHAGTPINVVPWLTGFERNRKQPYPASGLDTQCISIVHLNLDLLYNLKALDEEPLKSLVSPGRYSIAIIYWELISIMPKWFPIIHSFDEIWVSSRFMARAIGAVSSRPVRVVRPAILEAQGHAGLPPAEPIAPGRFLFSYSADAGSIMNRKNPQALWRAYADAFSPDDGAALAIKLHYPDPADPRVQEIEALAREREDVVYISHSLSEAEMAAFFARTDCYVSPHRSEGLGLTILEAMQAGKPVIATAYGGAADFVTPETAFVIDHRLVEVGRGAEPYPANFVWADPDMESLRAQLRKVFDDPASAAPKVSRARETCEALFSLATTSAALKREVDRIWTLGGGVAGAAG